MNFIDSKPSIIYHTDSTKVFITKNILLSNGTVDTIAGKWEKCLFCGFSPDGTKATSASLGCANSVQVHNNEVYFSDCFNNRIRKINLNGVLQTIAGKQGMVMRVIMEMVY